MRETKERTKSMSMNPSEKSARHRLSVLELFRRRAGIFLAFEGLKERLTENRPESFLA